MTRLVRHACTPFGKIAYTDRGCGPCALFVHGIFMNGYLWRHVIDRVADMRRCVAVDLLAHGLTQTSDTADVSFTGQAHMLKAFCDSMDIEQVDLVANDSGGAVAQIFAAHYPHRLRSLTLTNCDTHDNYPPKAFEATRALVWEGRLRELLCALLDDIDRARASFAVGYEHPERLDVDTLRTYLEPLTTPPAIKHLMRWFSAADDCTQTTRIRSKLQALHVPTLVAWGTGDPFFSVRWAHWLRDTIPGVRRVIELEGAKLFFPEERPDELAQALREHWSIGVEKAA